VYKEKGRSLTYLILLHVIYENGCCVHLKLMTAVEKNFVGDVTDCNGALALIF
jgi:hypothetical protein